MAAEGALSEDPQIPIVRIETKTIDAKTGPRLARTKWMNGLVSQLNKMVGYEQIQVDLCDPDTSTTMRVYIMAKRVG